MPGESIVDEDEVSIDEHSRRQVVADHRRNEGPRLHFHRLNEIVVEAILGIEPNVGLVAADMSQPQPVVGEVPDEPLEAVAGDQSIGLALQGPAIAKLSSPSQFQHRLIRPSIREQMRQPRRNREFIVRANGLAEVDEVAR